MTERTLLEDFSAAPTTKMANKWNRKMKMKNDGILHYVKQKISKETSIKYWKER